MRPGARALILTWLATAVVSAVACAPAGPRSPGRAPAPEVVAEQPEPAPEAWVVRRDGTPRRHAFWIRAELASQRDADTTVRLDSLHARFEVAWSEPTTTWPRRWIGAVSNYRSGAVADSLTVVPELTTPLRFVAGQATPGTGPVFGEPDLGRCDLPGSGALLAVRDLWPPLPDTIRPGQVWRDSTTAVVCLDSIPVVTVVRREFEVVGTVDAPQDVVLEVVRRSVTTLRGSGRQFGDSVRVEGRGDAVMVYRIAPDGARILSADGDATLTVTLRGSRRSAGTTQRSRIEIRER